MLFQPRSCRMLVEACRNRAQWQSAKIGKRGPDGQVQAVVDADYRTADVLFSEHLGPLGRRFDEKMDGLVKPLVRHLWKRRLTLHYGTQLVRYRPGGHYRAHSDIGRQTLNRYYTVLCYLNDDFTGGGTHFPGLGYTVKPRAGKAVIFPSGFAHSGEVVTSGEKYILVSWLIGPVRTLEEALAPESD